MSRSQFFSPMWLLALASSVLMTGTRCLAQADTAPSGKLVITKAEYGDLPDGAKSDVTAKVVAMMKDNALSVEASNDNFDDPAEGVVKKLTVYYTIDGVAHSKTVDEGDTLSIVGKPDRLVIRKAVYGDLPDGAKTDVTAKVADMVSNDSLSVPANNDNFGDPAVGIAKKLQVDYTFDGKTLSKTVDENETLTISNTGE